MKNKIYLLLGMLILFISVASAVTVNYPVNYAVQEQNGVFNTTSTPINGANVRAHYCLNVGCSLVDPNPFYTYSIPSGSNIAKVVYPTTLVGVGYRVYTYKNNYIGWEFFSNRSGNGEVTSSAIIYLSQKRTKSADILDFDYSNDSNCVEVSADIKSPVSDVRQSNVPLMEEASVLATFQVFKNGVSISNETDSLSIEYSTEEPVEFEYCGLTAGNYTFYLHSDITDQKVINPVRDTESFTLIIPESCVPTTEVCDGQDNDCDGQVDEGNVCGVCTPGQTQACSTGLLGVCSAGTMTCNGLGQWGSCVQNTQSSTEVCDSLDNDCDGLIDEGLNCNPECTQDSDCSSYNFNSSNYCYSDDVYTNLTLFGCSSYTCQPSSVLSIFIRDCGVDTLESGELYCIGSNVVRDVYTVDRGCGGNACFANNSSETELVETCEYGCSDGSCNSPAPNVEIIKPQNIIYRTLIIPFQVISDQIISLWTYSINSSTPVSFVPNSSLTFNSTGLYRLDVSGQNGNGTGTDFVYFTIEMSHSGD